MAEIPDYILAQVHHLAAEPGMTVGRMAFLMRLSPSIIEEELHHPTVPVNTTNKQVPLYEDDTSAEAGESEK